MNPLDDSHDTESSANPYASPGVTGPHLIPSAIAVGIWRLDDTIVMHRDARMPLRCFRTNQPCDQSESRIYAGSSLFVNWFTRITLISIGTLGAAALFLYDDSTYNRWTAAAAFLGALLVTWLAAPFGAKEIRIIYYHSRFSRQRRRNWRIAGVATAVCGILLLPILDPAYRPNWLPDFAAAAPVLLLLAGGTMTARVLTGFRAMHFQGPYLLLAGCGKEFIGSFPEFTLEFRQTAGAWIRRHIQIME